MKLVNDWYVPDHMKTPGNHIRRAGVIYSALQYLPKNRRGVAIQAGGHIGIWPSKLSQNFQKVFTWEPMPENWECLVANCKDIENVTMTQGCLGEKHADVRMRYSQRNTGKHCIANNGTVNSTIETLDSFLPIATTPVDAIFLDIEGYELMALVGADKILTRDQPLLVIEENGLQKRYGLGDTQIEEHLEEKGYVQKERWEEDVIYVHNPS